MDAVSPKTLLITGGAGFIGTNFIRHVLSVRPGWRIVNLDALTYAGNLANFADLPTDQAKRHDFIRGDIRDTILLRRIFSEKGLDAIIHFAAASHVDRSIVEPETFLDTNVVGTFRLLETSLRYWETAGRPDEFRFLHVSTDEVYGSLGPEGCFTEKSPYDPSSPYSASKAASDHFVRAYFRTFGLPTLITNCSNNFGPYQFPEKLIPLMILQIVEQEPLPIYGDGKNTRDWLYVADHCEALLKVLEDGVPGETYNIGGGAERQNLEIVGLLCEILDSRLGRTGCKASQQLIRFVADRPGHDRRYAIGSDKIRANLGWTPRHRLEGALEATVDWYLSHMEWIASVRSGEYRKWIDVNYGFRMACNGERSPAIPADSNEGGNS